MVSDPDGPADGGAGPHPDEPRHPRLRRIVRESDQKSIAPVLGLTFVAMLLGPVLSDANWSRGLEVALIGISAVVALVRTGAHPVVRRAGTVIVVIATLAGAAIPVVHESQTGTLEVIAAGLFALLLLVTPFLVLVRLMLRPRITVDTLAGALTAYLQIGIFFGALFLFLALVGGPSDYFAQTNAPQYSDFEYFSFITMTTVGYGDLTPATRLGQTLATMEAVIGQVFLVTVVALTVSNLGRPTRRSGSTRRPLPPTDPTD